MPKNFRPSFTSCTNELLLSFTEQYIQYKYQPCPVFDYHKRQNNSATCCTASVQLTAPPLPDSYQSHPTTTVPDVACNIKSVTVPNVDMPNTINGQVETAGSEEIIWFQCSPILRSLQKGEHIIFHALQSYTVEYFCRNKGPVVATVCESSFPSNFQTQTDRNEENSREVEPWKDPCDGSFSTTILPCAICKRRQIYAMIGVELRACG